MGPPPGMGMGSQLLLAAALQAHSGQAAKSKPADTSAGTSSSAAMPGLPFDTVVRGDARSFSSDTFEVKVVV